MTLYIVETGSWAESYIIFISDDLEKAEEIFKKKALENKEEEFMRWVEIREMEIDTRYADMGFGDTSPYLKLVKREINQTND